MWEGISSSVIVIVSTIVPRLSAVSIISGVRFTFRTIIGPPRNIWLRRVNPPGLPMTSLVAVCSTASFFPWYSFVDGLGDIVPFWRG